MYDTVVTVLHYLVMAATLHFTISMQLLHTCLYSIAKQRNSTASTWLSWDDMTEEERVFTCMLCQKLNFSCFRKRSRHKQESEKAERIMFRQEWTEQTYNDWSAKSLVRVGGMGHCTCVCVVYSKEAGRRRSRSFPPSLTARKPATSRQH